MSSSHNAAIRVDDCKTPANTSTETTKKGGGIDQRTNGVDDASTDHKILRHRDHPHQGSFRRTGTNLGSK